MTDTLDLKSRLAKLRLAGVQQDQHVKKKIQDDNEWEDIKKESYEEPQPAYPEEIEAAEEQRKSIYGKKEKEEYAYEDYFGKKYKKEKGKKVNLSRDDSLHLMGS